MNLPGVTQLIGPNKGKTIVIMAGVHGNEHAGVLALDLLEKGLSIKSGIVYLVRANTEALRQNVRFVENNMNRCFSNSNRGTTLEERRAKELMAILNAADVLLDLHTFNDTDGEPFVITDEQSVKVAEILDVPIISTGWDKIHIGSADGYVRFQGKVGICLECGPIGEVRRSTSMAIDSIYRVLDYYEMFEYSYPNPTPKKYVSIERSIIKRSNNLSFSKIFKNFEMLPEGRIYAKDGSISFVSNKKECIIFLRPQVPVGGEAAIIGRYL